jgi:hypothetical protein
MAARYDLAVGDWNYNRSHDCDSATKFQGSCLDTCGGVWCLARQYVSQANSVMVLYPAKYREVGFSETGRSYALVDAIGGIL